jgi:hypothetical protein
MDYRDAFNTLQDAIVETMADGEKEHWFATHHLPEESRMELLIKYIEHRMTHVNGIADTLDGMAVTHHEIMQSYERAGFNHNDALGMTHLMVTIGMCHHDN